MKKYNLEKLFMIIKRNLKNKVKITKSTVLAFLMVGSIGVAQKIGNVEIEGKNQSVVISNDEDVVDKSKYKHEAKDSVVIGNRIIARSENNGGNLVSNLITTSVLIGSELTTNSNSTVNIGYKNTTGEISNVTIGDSLNSKGQYTIVIGSNSSVKDSNEIKNDLEKDEDYKILKMYSKNKNTTINSKNNYDSSIIIGRESNSYNQGTVSIGHRASTYGEKSIAVGDNSKTYNERSIAFGVNSKSLGQQAYAIGYQALTYDVNGISIGTGATSAKEQGISIGNLSMVNGKNSIALGTNSKVGEAVAYNSIRRPPRNSVVDNGIAIGNSSTVIMKNSTAIGYGATASGNSSLAIGNVEEDNIRGVLTKKTEAKGEKSIAIGTKAQTEGNMSLSIGYNTKSNEESSVTVGQNLENKSEHSVLIGDTAKNEEKSNNSVAIGYKAEVALKDAVAIGSESEAKTEGKKVEGATVNRWNYGKHNSSGTAFAGALTEKNRIVSFGSNGKERQLKFVASGEISEKSTDAINGSQLYLTNMSVSKLGDSLVDVIGSDIVEISKEGNDLGKINIKKDQKGIGDTGKNTIHEAIKHINNIVNLPRESKLAYKSNGKSDTEKQVELNKGLDFHGDENLTSNVASDGKVTYTLNKKLNNIEEIAKDNNLSIKFGDNIELKKGNTTVSVTDNGLDLGKKKLLNVEAGVSDSDGVNYGQIKNFIKEEDLKAIRFNGNEGNKDIRLGESFSIKGEDDGDINVIVEGEGAKLKLNKSKVEKDGTKTVNAGDIYNAIKDAKTKVNADGDAYINVEKNEGEGIKENTYKLSINKNQLKNDFQNELMITYKANGEGKEYVLLKDGLDFNGDENINASVEAGGKVKYLLNKNLQNINSISSKDGNSKIELSEKLKLNGGGTAVVIDDKEVDFGDKKLLKVAAGTYDTDGVNYSQIKNLAKNDLSNLVDLDINAKNKLNELVVVKGDNVTTTVENTVESGIKTYTVKAKLDNYAKKDQIKPITFAGNNGKKNISLGETFNIKGDKAGDITVKVEEDGAKLSLNKTNKVAENEEKVVSSKGIYKAIKDAKTKVSQKQGEQYITVEKTESEDIKANNYTLSMNFEKLKEDLNNQLMFTYKAGGNNKKIVSLSKGLDFYGDENISTSVEDNGKVNVKLNKDLKGIESIKKNENSKVTFGDRKVSLKGGDSIIILGDNGLDLGNKKITKLEKGTEDTDAVNFSQLKEVESKLSKQGDKTLTFEADNSSNSETKFVRKNSENATLKITSGNIDENYLGKNLKTSIDDKGNLKIGFAKNPEFEGLKLKNSNSEVNLKVDDKGKFTANDKEVITAGNTNEYFKAEGPGFTVSTNDKGVITYKIEKSEGIKDKPEEYEGKDSERLVTDKQVTEFVKKKVDDIKGEVNDKIDNLEIKYTSNGDKLKKSVKLKDGFDFKDGTNTTATVEEGGVVKFNVNKELKEMTSFETSKAKNGNLSKLNAEGLTIKNGEGENPNKQATYGLDKTVIKDGNKSVEIKPDSITFGNKKGVITGLKDIPNDYNDGSVAVNKNYVDEKVLKFKGDEGEVITRKLDSQLNILGDGNISVKSGNDDTLNVTLSKDIKGINSIELGKVNISTKGLDNGGNRITNVAEGVNPTDAVNVSQLGKASDRGIAVATTSIAMANIPQVGDNKLFSIGAGLGYSGKQGAFAVGVSGTERTNTFIYKLSAGIDTQKQFSVGAGFNMNFGDNRIKLKDAEIAKLKDKNKKLEDRLDNMEKEIANMKQNDFREKLYVIDQFINDEYIPTEMQVKKLKAIVKEINEKYSDRIIDISGHTDTNYYERYNLDLGLRRANKVYEMLIELGLENPQNIRKVSSYGYNNKVNSKDGVGILSSNRRVEIYIK